MKDKKLRIAIIGAGSMSFTLTLVRDILAVPELQDAEIRLMDIDEEVLEMVHRLCLKEVAVRSLKTVITATTERSRALEGADYVFCTIRVGGLEELAGDIEIPMKYGVDQCVGDTLGPGGIFYALRTIPVLLGLAADMRRFCPEALLLNYTNPMAMNIWALHRRGGVRAVGLCHGVQHGEMDIARALGVPRQDLSFVCAGINHQAWFLSIRHRGREMTPFLLEAFLNDAELAAHEPVRIDMLRRFGYFSTETNGHLSEYLPWYRKRPEDLERWIHHDYWMGGESGGYLRACRKRNASFRQDYLQLLDEVEKGPDSWHRSVEHGSYIIESLVTGRSYKGCFNVLNTGLISNLPPGCVVEVPCLVDGSGIQPTCVGELPLACAAVCRASVTVQEMAVEAALTGNRELVKQAVLMDPLTAAVCNTDEVWRMCDELFAAHAAFLPQFMVQE